MEEKFVGCVMGALVGDCFGSPFELAFDDPSPRTVVTFLEERLAVVDPAKLLELSYTDDTEMARSVAESLLTCKDFDAVDMAERFVKEFYGPSQAKRGYGCFVRDVFRKLREQEGLEKDVYAPAAEQFAGKGSLGNGAAMRTYPVALFCHEMDQEAMFHICRQVSRITHSHLDGYNGAILQTMAVRLALNADPKQPLDVMDFLEKLKNVMKELESNRPANSTFPSYCDQIDNIKSALETEDGNPSVLGRKLGTEETAPLSVPAALYCFLRSQKPIEDYPTQNPFLRTLYLAISLGGDTDTIGTMACAISGAYHGKGSVHDVLFQQCEAWTELVDQAQRMVAHLHLKPSA